MNVIIIDDNKHFREGFNYFLEEKLNINVVAVYETGKQALKQINFPEADIVFMDIEMPEIDGIETAKRLLKVFPKLKIIAVTMYEDNIYLEELKNVGFWGCISKDEIFDKISEVIIHIIRGKFSFYEKRKAG